MAQQTAVNWLIEFIQDHCIRIDEKVIEQAKAMEKEQIMDACVKFGNNNGVDIEDYEEYYNENYG